MTEIDLLRKATQIEQRIKNANKPARLAMQPELSRVLESLQAEGGQVPLRLRQLESALSDEAIEARFDNMPI